MTFRVLRSLWPGLLPLALTACMVPEPAAANQSAASSAPLGVDLGAAPGRAAAQGERPALQAALPGMSDAKKPGNAGAMQMAQAGQAPAQGTGTVNSVDATARKINMNHGPIPAIGWPGMTMDFGVAPAVDLGAVKPGTRVNFTIEQGEGGMYVIQSIAPAGGGR